MRKFLHMPGHPIAVCLPVKPGLRKISACMVSWAEAWMFLLEAHFRYNLCKRSLENLQKLDAPGANANSCLLALTVCLLAGCSVLSKDTGGG